MVSCDKNLLTLHNKTTKKKTQIQSACAHDIILGTIILYYYYFKEWTQKKINLLQRSICLKSR